MAKIELGDKVKDTVSGFKGVAIGRTQWIQGCDRITLQPPVDKEGKLPESHTFDELQLEIVDTPKKKTVRSKTGGPIPKPLMQPDPSRL